MEEPRWRAGGGTHGVAHGGLQGGVLLGLAADVVEGEQQVVVVRQVGGNLHLGLLVELGGPWGTGETHGGVRAKEGAEERWRGDTG